MWNYISPLLSLLLIAAAATGQCDFEKVGSWSPPESTTIATDNEHLYLNRGGDLIIADRAITDHLFVLGELELPGTIQRIFPEGDQLWILSGDDGLFLVDISDPSIPNLITALDTSGWGPRNRSSGPICLYCRWQWRSAGRGYVEPLASRRG